MDGLMYWHWLILALLLIIAETLGAAGFLVALSLAALITAAITRLFVISWQWQLIDFSILCVCCAIAWWYYLKHRTDSHSPSLINRPFEALIERIVTLVEPIKNGRGKIQVDDCFWVVTGPELPAGSTVKIIAVKDETLLVVECVKSADINNALNP